MKILALDSSGLVASVAVVEDDVLLAQYTVNYKKTHSQTLLPMLEEIRNMIELDLNTIDAIAIASGPGSFTGLRIGSATAKGLGLALNRPLVEVPTLEGLAYNLCGTDRLVCPLMDARRNQVYSGIYAFQREGHGWKMETVKEQCAADISVMADACNELGREVIFLGDGVPVFAEKLKAALQVPYSFAPAQCNRQSAASIAALGAVYFAQGKAVSAAAHQPQYLRMSQAERERAEAKGFIVRSMEQKDVEAVSRIEAECFSRPWSANAYYKVLEDKNSLYLVAEADGTVVGMCGVTDISGEGDINNVAVTAAFRKKGIAAAMLGELLRRGEERGIRDFTLEVRLGNEAAIHAYEKLGFCSEGIRPGFYDDPKEDAMIMWRRHQPVRHGEMPSGSGL